ncbi:hypothetical protein BAE44_0021053 [Dichanthelium oligosanthes]|uniref:Bifunctional inhibitor/plant lipid transfer protein/seed storage helical domain-containing protein n=1 Tax=Dichanthelium oligosanthes TaxID=888268 RepID=A0A1E5UYJ8_9POAL|nr:hypothetical protein BAE44_0021053 [Dichanthelium oligosanthes]
MGKATTTTVLAAALCAAVLLLSTAHQLDAASCNPAALSPCGGALLGGAVTPGCCAQLKAQQACLCQYARNPAYRNYVNGPAAQSVTKACGLPKMKC